MYRQAYLKGEPEMYLNDTYHIDIRQPEHGITRNDLINVAAALMGKLLHLQGHASVIVEAHETYDDGGPESGPHLCQGGHEIRLIIPHHALYDFQLQHDPTWVPQEEFDEPFPTCDMPPLEKYMEGFIAPFAGDALVSMFSDEDGDRIITLGWQDL